MHYDPKLRPELSALTGFAVNRLDRMAERRDEAEFVASLAADSGARCLVFAGDMPLLKQEGEALEPLFTFAETAALGKELELAFLGQFAEGQVAEGQFAEGQFAEGQVAEANVRRSIFARLVEADLSEAALSRAKLVAIDLRTLATRGLLAAELIGALGQAKSLLYWHQRHRFCSTCGAPTQSLAAGWRRDCAACGVQHFPRTDPVVIMLVTHGDTCLLGRQPKFPPNMYSCLAGFVEGGETLEDAVRREIFEEAGLTAGRVTYAASQTWPFPSSLMLGCVAEAMHSELVIDKNELDDARWFSREELGLMFSKTHPAGIFCPPKFAIANLLIRSWLKGEIG